VEEIITAEKNYALIEIPKPVLGRFIQLPSPLHEHHIILLEDVIRCNLPRSFPISVMTNTALMYLK
jgi:polyphosphate kinase